MTQLPEEIFKKYGLPAIIFFVILILCFWGLAHFISAPDSEVSILWGLVKYTKKGIVTIGEPSVQSSSTVSFPPKSSDSVAVMTIRSETSEILKRTGSAAGGLWLMAEATTSGRKDLLQLVDQLKSESRAEALAHLAYTLAVFGRPEDALYFAEGSLAATGEIHKDVRCYSLVDLTETFAKAKLIATALKAAEQAIAIAKQTNETTGLPRLVSVLVRISSVNHGLTVAHGIEDPKARSEVLSAIVNELIKHDRIQEAGQVFQEVLSTSLKIQKMSDRASALAQRTRELSKLGRYDESIKLSKQAKEEAQKIDPNELFGEFTTKWITSEMSLFERTHDEILMIANINKKPDILVRLARFMRKHSPDTDRVINEALALAIEIQNPLVLAEVSELQQDTDSPDESVKSAKRATEIALTSNNPRTRDATLRKTSKVFAHTGNFKAAFAAADGIDDVEYCAKLITELLIRCYARKGKPGEKVSETLSRAFHASENLKDKDRSEVLMYLGVSHALLGNFNEAYKIAKLAPFSSHRLAAYSIIVFMYELQFLPDSERQLRNANNEALLAMLTPVYAWDLVD